MAEKRLSGEEQRAKMKEEYKKDLKLRKQFLDDVKEHKRVKTLSDAVIEITSANDKDDTDVWVEKLNQDSALSEAKMEMAFESTGNAGDGLPSEKERLAMSDAEIRKIKAQELVNQMKAEMSGTGTQPVPKVELSKESAPESKPVAEQQVPVNQQPPATPTDERPPRKMLEDI